MSPITIIAFLIAVAIPIGAVYIIFAVDLFGTGKRSTILFCLGWGAVGAFGLAYLTNSEVLKYLGYELTVTLAGPIIEELLKSAFLLFLVTQPRFHYFVDGAVYGFACGIGFAVTENMLYISTYPDAALSVSISRALSTSLMHATTSALVGLSLGHLRRSKSSTKFVWAFIGFVPAMITHVVFNNLVDHLTGSLLLLFGIGIGIGGAALIGFLISRGLADEKKSFAQTLGVAGSGVSKQERRAVQKLGGEAVETVLKELGARFGEDKVPFIRRLLITQANIGILQGNLNNPVSERLRKAWQEEIDTKRAEIKRLQKELGANVMLFLRSVFPDDEKATQDTFRKELAVTDPTQIHTFDMFITASRISKTFSPQELSDIADLLSQIDLFKGVSLPDLENLSRAITLRKFNDGELVFDEGQPGDEMFVITGGAIQIISVDKQDHSEKPLNLCKAGELVGELTLLDGLARSARARASGELETLVLPRNQFMSFIQSRPTVILALLRYLVGRARHVSDIVDHSIEWASDVAQGKFDHSASVLAPAWAAAPTTPGTGMFRITSRVALTDHAERANVNEDTAVLLHSVFSRVSSALDQKTQAVSAAPAAATNKGRISGLFGMSTLGGATSSAANAARSTQSATVVPTPAAPNPARVTPHLTSLSTDQQLIVRCLQDGVANVENGASIETIRGELTSIADVQPPLDDLITRGWLTLNDGQYVLSPNYRRGATTSDPSERPTDPPTPDSNSGKSSTGIFSRIKTS